ncbi:MAG: hypothetical protein IJT66_07285, partial [Clostridia bacterium]|nr:hypothetical protein [Clostridia bacterium]
MAEVVSVKFNENGRQYFFAPCGNRFRTGDSVIVETQNGIEFGTVTKSNHEVTDDEIVSPLRKVLRHANERDFQRLEENHRKEKDAMKICEEQIARHQLDMKLVSVEYSFDGNKILFFFT